MGWYRLTRYCMMARLSNTTRPLSTKVGIVCAGLSCVSKNKFNLHVHPCRKGATFPHSLHLPYLDELWCSCSTVLDRLEIELDTQRFCSGQHCPAGWAHRRIVEVDWHFGRMVIHKQPDVADSTVDLSLSATTSFYITQKRSSKTRMEMWPNCTVSALLL